MSVEAGGRGTGAPDSAAPDSPGWAKLALDLGPLLLFFAANAAAGIFAATAIFMVAIFAALVAQKLLFGKLSALPIITAGLVLVFGGLTLWLQNETFIKLKPTVLYLIFAAVLAGGMIAGRSLLPLLLGSVLRLDREGWRLLTWRWAGFFVAMAALNEIVWRNSSTDVWVAFKTFGVLPLTFLFAIFQSRLVERYQLAPERTASSAKSGGALRK